MKFAINPLQWGALPNGGLDMDRLPSWPELMAELAGLGIAAVHTLAERTEQLAEYRAALAGAGMEPAPGYFWFPAAEAVGEALDEHLRRAEQAARVHAALDLEHVFIADGLNPVRLSRPAIGAEPDDARLRVMREGFVRVAEAFHAHGVLPCLHQHVASWVESEQEYLWMLEHTDPDLLGAGPDTGHLAFVGADPAAVIARLGARVHVAHLKDVHTDRLPVTAGLSYHQAVATDVYTEPGRGGLDLDRCLELLDQAGAAWAVVEVDRPDRLSPSDSARRCADWIKARTIADTEAPAHV